MEAMGLLHDTVLAPFAEFAFMRRALVAILALSLSAAPLGVFLTLRRMSLLGDALSHAVLPGVAIGFMLSGLSLAAMATGGVLAGIAVAALAGLVTRFTALREDASLAAVYLIALALGVTLISGHGTQLDLPHILFGSALGVDDQGLLLVAGVASLSLVALAALYRGLVLETFDPLFLAAGGRHSWVWHQAFLLLVVINLVAGFQTLGTLMAVGLMMIPAVVASTGVKPRTLAGEQGHKPKHDVTDPHAWQSPKIVAQYVRNIAAGLGRLDPTGAGAYATARDTYLRELQSLDEWIRAQLAPIPVAQRKVITSHDAFGYFAAEYQVAFLAAQGVSTDSAPSARAVGELVRQIKREKIRTVFVEAMSDPKLVRQIGRDTGASVGGSLYSDALSSADKPGATYLQMMRHNVTLLVQGMQKS